MLRTAPVPIRTTESKTSKDTKINMANQMLENHQTTILLIGNSNSRKNELFKEMTGCQVGTREDYERRVLRGTDINVILTPRLKVVEAELSSGQYLTNEVSFYHLESFLQIMYHDSIKFEIIYYPGPTESLSELVLQYSPYVFGF